MDFFLDEWQSTITKTRVIYYSFIMRNGHQGKAWGTLVSLLFSSRVYNDHQSKGEVDDTLALKETDHGR